MQGDCQGFLAVLKYGHCYRFLGVTDNEANDLDLLLIDANGVAGYQAGQDLVIHLDNPNHVESIGTATFV